MALEDVIATKVLSLTEHSVDYATLLVMARALREQIDWGAVRRQPIENSLVKRGAGRSVDNWGSVDNYGFRVRWAKWTSMAVCLMVSATTREPWPASYWRLG